MYHIKNDQRAVRSSKMLYAALATLMREKSFATITVTDLVNSAQVGRATFYRNFDEIEDVLRMGCDQTFQGLIRYFKEYLQNHPEQTETKLLKPLLRYFYLHSEIIELLIIAKRIDIIQDSFQLVIEPFKASLSTLHNVDEEFVEYGIAIQAGVMTNILIHWIKTDKKQAPDKLADALGDMLRNRVTLEALL